MRFVLIIFGFVIMSGCSALYSAGGDGDRDSFPRFQNFELVDKSVVPPDQEEQFFMYWERADLHCMSVIRDRYETIGFENRAQIFGMYRNCMGRNNFRLLPSYAVQDVVDKNREQYGLTYVIEKRWGR